MTAFFTNILIKKGIDGVLYPSVQAFGEGLCVAIKPSIAKKTLELEKVLQCRIIRNKNNVELRNEKFCFVKPKAKKFRLKAIENFVKANYPN